MNHKKFHKEDNPSLVHIPNVSFVKSKRDTNSTAWISSKATIASRFELGPSLNKIHDKESMEDEKNQKEPETDDKKENDKDEKCEEPISLKENSAAYKFRHLIFSPHIDNQTLLLYSLKIHEGLKYAFTLRQPLENSLKSHQVILQPESQFSKTLLLDLDETLIYRCDLDELPDHIVNVGSSKIGFQIRPYLKEFLSNMSKYFEIVLFTASTEDYARAIMDEIDPERKFINFLLDRKYCLPTKKGYFVKDLRVIANRNLENLVLVDNLVQSFGMQIHNGIPILEWSGDKEDTELKYLESYLIMLSQCDNVSEFNRQNLRLCELARLTKDDIFGEVLEAAMTIHNNGLVLN